MRKIIFSGKFLKRTLLCVVLLFAGWRLAADHDAAVRLGLASKLDRLNLTPYYLRYVSVLASGEEPPDDERLPRLREYYTTVTQFMPERADAYGLRGFTDYYAGDISGAIQSYTTAQNKNPGFFWYPYNLGVIHFKQKQYGIAAEYFETALTRNPDDTIQSVLKSPSIYLPLLFNRFPACSGDNCVDPHSKIAIRGAYEELSEGYKRATRILMECRMHIKAGEAGKFIKESPLSRAVTIAGY